MTGPYIFIGKKYVALDTVETAERNDDGSYMLAAAGAVLDRRNGEFDSMLLQLIAPQGDWECLTAYLDEDETLAAHAEPVLAFGLNVFGTLVPVTAGAPSGVVADHVLRRPGQAAVFGASGAWYGGVDEWLDSLSEDDG